MKDGITKWGSGTNERTNKQKYILVAYLGEFRPVSFGQKIITHGHEEKNMKTWFGPPL